MRTATVVVSCGSLRSLFISLVQLAKYLYGVVLKIITIIIDYQHIMIFCLSQLKKSQLLLYKQVKEMQ